jgi:peroxiredoxin
MKSQAETAGRLGNSIGARPQKGTVLRDLEITTADGTRRLLSSLRSTSNLVMILAAGQDLSAFLAALLARKSALADNNGRVLVIATKPVRLAETVKWQNDFCLLAIDENCELHRALGATDNVQNPIPTIYVTDRFGEVFAAFQTVEIASLPSADEIIRWLEFIERQCEECSPPEWPE